MTPPAIEPHATGTARTDDGAELYWESSGNPDGLPLVWLHGGPGMDETGMWRRNNAALEDHFLVIYWTQRGTGRSYDSAIPATSMRLSRFVADLDELVDGEVQPRHLAVQPDQVLVALSQRGRGGGDSF